jgi:D-alanyl-D-alanine carboxypeptidase
MEKRNNILAVIAVIFVSIAYYRGATTSAIIAEVTSLPTPLPPTPLVLIEDPFKTIKLSAKSVFVYDVTTGKVIYSQNPDDQLPLASLTKIMTVITAKELIPDDTSITIDKSALQEEGDTGLRSGEKWKIADLLRFTLLVSSNDGAHALASAIAAIESVEGVKKDRKDFIAAMNENVKRIGLSKTYFINESGLDVSQGVSGGYGTARDVAKLFNYALVHHPDIFDITKEKNMSFVSETHIVHDGQNTNKIIEDIPHIIASKTGLSDLAGGNLVIEFMAKENRPVIIVVLGSTSQGRFDTMLTLVQTTEKYFAGL